MLRTRFQRSWQMARSTVDAWVDGDASSMGAALSYYTAFSLAPLLLIVIPVAGMLFGQEAVRGEIFGQLRGLTGPMQRQPSKRCWPTRGAPRKASSPR